MQNLIVVLFLFVYLFLPTIVFAQAPSLGPAPVGLTAITNMFDQVISISVILAFVVLLVVLVMAGIKFLTSGGEPKALEAAWQTITWGLLGILFLALAWLILRLVNVFTGTSIDLTIFNIRVFCANPQVQTSAVTVPGAPPATSFVLCP